MNMNKYLFLLLLSSCQPVYAERPCEYYHLDLGVGYKFQEQDYEGDRGVGRNPSAIFQLGCKTNWGGISIKHDSNYRDGMPFNNREEYHKTEIHLYKTFKFGR